jgi:hypothetical protein
MNSELAASVGGSSAMVPGDFAEKAMASLMQLHTELMDEKERRVELYRKLMEREQTVAELRMYVRLLEEKLEPPRSEPEPRIARNAQPAPMHTEAEPTFRIEIPTVTPHARAPESMPPEPPRMGRPKVDGWKTW